MVSLYRRYLPSQPFPEYAFIPGVNPHPYLAEPKTDPLDPFHPEKNDCYLYALDLFNHEYFWESHVYFEALWNVHGREGAVADFCKAMIKLAAAGMKWKQKETERARVHFERAEELIASLMKNDRYFLGCDLEKIKKDIKESQQRELRMLLLTPKFK